ncbi:MAG TPA: type II secretion system F family protein [Clostridiaceae bacterium]|nr:type II secretion system F family protein [Clostridiaceae bacterium]
MKFILAIYTLSIFLLYFFSRKKYSRHIAVLDSKQYPLKDFLVIGLHIIDLVKYKFNKSYDRILYSKFTELSGLKDARYYVKIHLANKIILLLFCIEFILFVGSFASLDKGFWIFACSLILSVLYFTDYELNRRINERRTAIQIDFPDFLNRLILLINAGMTISRAWEKVVTENNKPGPLKDELRRVLAEIRSGKPEIRAYIDFAKRCKTPEITRFVSVMIQNIKKGNSELVSILRVQSNDCWQMRKNTAKKLGEEASTKMIFPLMLMFAAILAIVTTPAILSLGQMI